MKTYSQVLDYLYAQLPMFHRIGAAAYKANLDNTISICDVLSNPQNRLRCVHIAGTNGKGSTSHMLAAVLQAAGYKVGLYTSPHLKDFRERIRINGKMISKKEVIGFVNTYKTNFEPIAPSFFEWTVGLAFHYFYNQKVDIAIIETGLGGRLDSTNIITPLLSIITNISFDHQAILGDTLAQIAHEKAGIIKEGVPVIVSEFQEEVEGIFRQKATELNAPICFAGLVYAISTASITTQLLTVDAYANGQLVYKNLQLDLPGLYQLNNCKGVIHSIQILNESGFSITEKQVRGGLKRVKKLTGLQGRWQVLNTKPLTVCDTGHNEAGIKVILQQLATTTHRKLHWVLGMVNDKDIAKVLALLPQKAQYYFCKPAIPRGLDEQELKQQAHAVGLRGESYASVKEAFLAAKKRAAKDDLLLVAGSNFVVAEVL